MLHARARDRQLRRLEHMLIRSIIITEITGSVATIAQRVIIGGVAVAVDGITTRRCAVGSRRLSGSSASVSLFHLRVDCDRCGA